MGEEQNRFSLRKLSVGLASVLIGVSIFGTSQTVKADTVASNQTSSVTNNAQSSDTQENKNAVKSTFSNDNQVDNAKSNLIQTQVEGKKDQKQDSVPNTQEATDGSNLDAENDIVRTSSLQEPDNQSNNHAEDNSQTQNEQKLDLTKNSKKLAKKVLATNLIENQNNDDWADPAKQGFHYTTAGWTTEQQGKDYTDVAKRSHTILINQGTGKELDKNNSYEVGQGSGWGVDITATVDKSLIKQGNKILISNVALLSKDTTRMLQYTVKSANTMNIVSNGVKIGHIEAVSNYEPSSHRNMSYFLIVDQTQNMAKDLNLHFKINNSYTFNDQSAHFGYYKGTTPSNPAQFKLITNNSDLYNYTIYVDPNKTEKPYKVDSLDEIGSYLNQQLNDGEIDLGHIRHNPSQSFNIQDFAINRVFKLSRPKKINNIVIPNFKSSNFTPTLEVNTYYPILNKDGYLDSVWEAWYSIKGQKLADGLSVQQVNELVKKNHVVFSISNDGQSMLIGINIVPSLANLTKLSNKPQTINQITNEVKYYLYGSRAVAIDYPNDATNIINYSTNWIKNNNGEPYDLAIGLTGFPKSYLSPLVQTFTDVTPNINNPISKTDTYVPNGYDINVDTSVYKQLNVKFVDDDNNEKVINTDTFTTSTGTDLTYNIKDATDKTFTSTTDIAFPSNYVLNQPTTVHFGVIQDTNPDIIIHVKHLVKIISGDADLDLYPEIKKALNGDARRTITITYPAGKQGNNPSTIVQSVHYIRSGKVDFTNDTVDESSLTKWNPVASSTHGVTITNGETTFDAVKLPHINGYKAHLVRNKINPAMLMVSFVAVPTETKPSNPVEVAPSKPSANADNTNKPADDLKDLKQRVVTELNSNDSGWTMPTTADTHVIEVPTDSVSIDLSNLVIAEPVHAHTHTQIRVTKRFKLSKKHSIKHLKHRKKAVRTFRKYRL